MKKTCALIALAMFCFSSAATAATIVKKDGFTYKIKGDLQIQIRKDVGIDEDLDVEYDDLELKNYVSYDLNDNIKAFGGLDFGFKNAADKSNSDEGPHLEEAYLGMTFNKSYSLIVGKADSAAYEFGVEGAYETSTSEDAFEGFGAEDGDDLIKVVIENDNFTVMASHEIAADSEKSDDNGEFTDIFVSAKVAGLEFGAAYQMFEQGSDDYDIYGVSVAYDAKVVKVAADYSVAEDIADVMNLYVGVPVAETAKIGAGIVFTDPDDSTADEITEWYANATYKFPAHKNFSVFSEVSGDDQEKNGEDSEVGFLVGARLKF
ncbi:MAG: porin [Desulfuromonas sp.]|nr:MAG: porin [Desulfuromonas sp.]